MALLETQALRKHFGGFVAINNVSLSLSEGEKHAIIGPNGAGKTTFFNLITGHLSPSVGSVSFEGRDITRLPPHKIVKLGLARSFQRINIYARMTVFENIQVALIARDGKSLHMFSLGAKQNREETSALLELVGLNEEATEIAGELSYGKQKQLELAIALAENPRALLLDEPTAGMSPQETAEAIKLIDDITRSRGLTLLFTEHDMSVVFGIADRISVLHHGEIIATANRRMFETIRKYGAFIWVKKMAQLEVKGIHTAYGLSQVLFGVSFNVEAGQCVSLIGRNGVGKTTTMRSVIGLTPAGQGSITFEGNDITQQPTHRIAKMGLGFVPEERRIFPELTVWENLDIARRPPSPGQKTWDEKQVYELFPDLEKSRSASAAYSQAANNRC